MLQGGTSKLKDLKTVLDSFWKNIITNSSKNVRPRGILSLRVKRPFLDALIEGSLELWRSPLWKKDKLIICMPHQLFLPPLARETTTYFILALNSQDNQPSTPTASSIICFSNNKPLRKEHGCHLIVSKEKSQRFFQVIVMSRLSIKTGGSNLS